MSSLRRNFLPAIKADRAELNKRSKFKWKVGRQPFGHDCSDQLVNPGRRPGRDIATFDHLIEPLGATGPTSAAGSARSSQNAVRHGLTGQTLVLTPEEAESYAAHVTQYMAKYEPGDHYQRQLVQDLADSDWGIHQIFLLQSSTISYMQKLSRRLAEAADLEAEAEILASEARAVRKLATLNSYENRKRRASKMLREQIDEIAQQQAAERASKFNKKKPEPEIGFVHPNAANPAQPDDLQALLDRLDAGVTPEEELEIYKKLDTML